MRTTPYIRARDHKGGHRIQSQECSGRCRRVDRDVITCLPPPGPNHFFRYISAYSTRPKIGKKEENQELLEMMRAQYGVDKLRWAEQTVHTPYSHGWTGCVLCSPRPRVSGDALAEVHRRRTLRLGCDQLEPLLSCAHTVSQAIFSC